MRALGRASSGTKAGCYSFQRTRGVLSMRNCANPKCRAPITGCFGYVLASDIILAIEGSLHVSEVRELCAKCCFALEDHPEATQTFPHPSNNIPVEVREVLCRFHHEELAVARYATPSGCACFPHDKEQDLCAQHALKSEPLGEMTAILVYQPEVWKLMNSRIAGRQ